MGMALRSLSIMMMGPSSGGLVVVTIVRTRHSRLAFGYVFLGALSGALAF